MDISDKLRKNYSRAVIYNPKTNKFLFTHFANCQNPTKWGLAGGSLEERENIEESLKREIIEETGLTDFTIVCKLGGKIISPKDPEFDDKDFD